MLQEEDVQGDKSKGKKSINFPYHLALQERKRRVLIVEDDLVYRQFWHGVITENQPLVAINWASSEEVAEQLIREKYQEADPYDLVILDIFLSGQKTGLDLWLKLRKAAKEFLLVSSMPKKKYEDLIRGDEEGPVCLEKPLIASECARIICSMM